MEKNIAVVGAGEIGSRHLQALKKLELKTNIFVLDPKEKSLQLAKTRYEETSAMFNDEKKVFYIKKIEELPQSIDVAIISTTSIIRSSIIKKLLVEKEVGYLILEKFLFPQIDHYYEVEKILEERKVQAYVNCTRRMWPFYKEFKQEFSDASNINYVVTGSHLGIGCNGIHFVDHLSYIGDDLNFMFDNSKLDSALKSSKREGYIEFTGVLNGWTEKGHQISITSYPSGNAPPLIKIYSDKVRCIIKENESTAWISRASEGWVWEEVNFAVPYQSELTHLAVNQLIETNSCELTDYNKSSCLHVSMLKTFLDHLQKITLKEVKECAIT